MRIAHTDPSKYRDAHRAHSGAGTIRYMELWGDKDFGTNWMFIHRGVLLPGGGIGHHRHDEFEECYVIFDGAARFTHNGNTAELAGGAMVPLRRGESHGIYNHTDQEVQFMNLGVATEKGKYDSTDFGDDLVNAPLCSPDKLPHRFIDRTLLKPVPNAHQGKGVLQSRRIWTHEDFKNNWGFISHVLIPPDCSIGYHRHDTIEEVYLILSGSGRMKVDGEVAEVHAGDAIPNKLGGCHGIYNHTKEPLEMLVICVTLEKGKFDATDFGDDLSGL